MTIVQMNMADYLGRGIQVFLKDGTAINFKPTEHIKIHEIDMWIGYDDEGQKMQIERKEIEFVKGAK